MCGICGYVEAKRDDDLLGRMMEALRHRGPDDEGRYEGTDASLGFRRLSIIDPAGGKQPVADGSGELRLVLNGEIDTTSLFSHRLTLEDAPVAYQMFCNKEDGCTKVVMTP